MGDILGKFAKNQQQEQKLEQSVETQTTQEDLGRGVDMIGKLGVKTQEAQVAAKELSEENTQDKGGVLVDDPNTWTKESAFKEIKKLREENKVSRLKYQEQIEKIKSEADVRLLQKEEEAKQLAEAKKELDRIKAEQEDKKRDLSEKVAYREAKLTELQGLMDAKERDYQNKISNYETTLKTYEAEKAAESEIYKNRIQEELGKVPEKYRDYANLIVKGAGDPRDALLALNEASLKGMFEDKTIIVNHSVPGATDGARSNKERLEEINKEQRSKMTSAQKIKESLKQVRSGQPNSAVRLK
jgi:hypothetical protein